MYIILDTNFLIYCAKEKIDYLEQINNIVRGKYELVVPKIVIKELEKIMKEAKKYSDKSGAELAIKLLKVNKVKIVNFSGEDADEAIINNSSGNYVATVDLGLAKRLTASKGVILIRARKKLSFR